LRNVSCVGHATLIMAWCGHCAGISAMEQPSPRSGRRASIIDQRAPPPPPQLCPAPPRSPRLGSPRLAICCRHVCRGRSIASLHATYQLTAAWGLGLQQHTAAVGGSSELI
jgi:hypothetical protein